MNHVGVASAATDCAERCSLAREPESSALKQRARQDSNL